MNWDVLIYWILGFVVCAFFLLLFLSLAIIAKKSDERAEEMYNNPDQLDRLLDEPIGSQIDKRV